ncbi:hypothetical protein VPH35_092449 [Triticum aestivum]
MEAVESSAVVSCECCGLGEECTGEYIVRVRAYFGGRWLCGLCSESVKYEAGRSKRAAAMGVEEAVRAHMAFCRMLSNILNSALQSIVRPFSKYYTSYNALIGRGGPAERVAEGICQMLRRRTAFGNCRVAISSSLSWRTTPAPVALASGPHNRASMEPLSIGL